MLLNQRVALVEHQDVAAAPERLCDALEGDRRRLELHPRGEAQVDAVALLREFE